ncbi:UNVERIFIED_CONTAM: hypothetical protein PYX00_004473 [Menopon gallinae]
MGATAIGSSTDELVNDKNGNKFPQYVAAIAATLGAFAFGTSLAWTSPISGKNDTYIDELLNGLSKDEKTETWSWIGALMPLGAASVALVIGPLIDKFGRKVTMLSLVIPFSVGWGLLIWPKELYMIYAGRFLLGMAGGSIAVASPVYTSEIAEKEIRGALGSYFQLMITLGILFVYVLGKCVNAFYLTVICGVVPLVFGAAFFFVPETPIYLLTKGNVDQARKSLTFFRGKNYNVELELSEMQENVNKSSSEKLSLMECFSTRAAKMGLFIGLALMLFQQFSGVNAVIFYTDEIFKAAKSELDTSSIIVGAMQFVATFLSTLMVDKLGRKILLLTSSSVMCICTLLLGVYFYLDGRGNNVEAIGWLPLASLCLFIVSFSLGYGPIPWMITGELFRPNAKGLAASIISFFNLILAFLVTKFYAPLSEVVGTAVTFWIFSGVLLLGTVFVFLIVKETKGKTTEEIQMQLGG